MTKEKVTDTQKENTSRPPIVTIMGHVDHGKTSLLDYIRKSSVALKEHGGITQKIGAYQAEFKGKKITFIDTPGHAAFTKMRQRGGQAADIVVLVVSADDGVMPQTKEAISHTKVSDTPLIVAINKIDVNGANPEKVKQQLAENEVLVEGWGGNVISVPVSAKTGEGVDALLESILTLSELLELKGEKEGDLEGIIIESKIDPKKGPVFTGIIKNGTLKVGSEVFTGEGSGKIKALLNFKGEAVSEAGPSEPIEVLGFSKVPSVGEIFVDLKNKELLEKRMQEKKTDEEFLAKTKVVNVILKADNQGSLEALEFSLRELENEEVRLKFLLKATGDINESDILLANSTGAKVLGFNSRISTKAAELADTLLVFVKTYNIIYKLIEDVQSVLKDVLFKEELKVKGRATILRIFTLASGDVVIGCKVTGGVLKPNSHIQILRELVSAPSTVIPSASEGSSAQRASAIPAPQSSLRSKSPLSAGSRPAGQSSEASSAVYTGRIKELHRGKDIVSVVGKDVECGVFLSPNFKDAKAGDIIDVL